MFELFKKVMPREERFFDMFDRHAAQVKAGAATLRRILDGGPQVAGLCKTLQDQETEADTISHEVLQAIRRTFITPFDRSDIQGLITAMDDAIDQMNKTAKTVVLYEVQSFEEPMRTMGDVIVKAADLLAEAVPLLRTMRNNSARLHKLTEEIVRLEEESDHLYDEGLKRLYHERGKTDTIGFIIGSQIYEQLEKVADRIEDVANTISGIVIEHL